MAIRGQFAAWAAIIDIDEPDPISSGALTITSKSSSGERQCTSTGVLTPGSVSKNRASEVEYIPHAVFLAFILSTDSTFQDGQEMISTENWGLGSVLCESKLSLFGSSHEAS